MTKISKRITHDAMSITGVMASGANVKFSIGRSGERIIAGLSNDPKIAKIQNAKLINWLRFREKETNAQRFERLEDALRKSNTAAEFIENLK